MKHTLWFNLLLGVLICGCGMLDSGQEKPRLTGAWNDGFSYFPTWEPGCFTFIRYDTLFFTVDSVFRNVTLEKTILSNSTLLDCLRAQGSVQLVSCMRFRLTFASSCVVFPVA